LLLGSGLDLTAIIFGTVAFILGLYVHEGNHALVATALGDDTPRRAGRLSLNPMRHVDKLGLIMFIIAGFGWGWTPVNPANLRPSPRIGNAIVAAAGPLANLLLAVLLSIPLRGDLNLPVLLHQFLFVVVSLNLLLFAFNLIPVPPLDGFTVLVGLLPAPLARSLRQVERFGPGLMLVVLVVLPLIGLNVVSLLFGPVSQVFGLRSLR
jgi:Zn-dependent protease